MALIKTDLSTLKLTAQGKVRDIYATEDPSTLLFVATDRISAYDVVLNNGIPNKGKILTQLSLFWFNKLKDVIPNHLVTANINEMPGEISSYSDQLEGRSMLVRKARVIQLEAIVRGYITGSAWSEYKKSGTVHGISLPEGLVESAKLPQPLFTPSTKAEVGQHDENIHPDVGAKLIGQELYDRVSSVAIKLYEQAAQHAQERGLILADTKFEFGLLTKEGAEEELILIDEVLTPDSSRYWPLEGYEAGRPQPSFDKQYLRDWLTRKGFVKGLERGVDGNGWTMDEDVVDGTRRRYEEAWEKLTK
ncbi:Bifunctional purine biosynthetic protein ade1 [Tulasnella sp. 419]|nr:Bifunctional purine biosynthetic protein ade1 [Tulasnella sp. 419]